MISDAMQQAISEQINLELFSAYTYLAMAEFCEANNLVGAAAWLRAQAKEELEHAMKFYDHVLDRGGRVRLAAVQAPRSDYGSLLQVFEAALAHEQQVSAAIHQLYERASAEKDYAALPLLQWFLDEQVEEERTVGEIVAQVKMVGESSTSLYFIDRHLGKRAES
ncbi:MAG: ferritin [Planctomycetota bacterium]|nr:MAG: ferritin [Planctomycetota bacterium]